jgi:beta-aspartyl-peptidase (threonine type)
MIASSTDMAAGTDPERESFTNPLERPKMRTDRSILILLLAVVVVATFLSCAEQKTAETPDFVLVVHGGAGTIVKHKMTPEKEQAVTEKLTEAMTRGYEILDGGGTAIAAVEAAIRVMEDSPLFNAGKGAVFTGDGKNELDASIMDGETLNAGAVASVTTIRNPITAARAVMLESKHVLLAGAGAEMFAAEQGLDIVKPDYFFSQDRWDQLLRDKEDQQTSTAPDDDEHKKYGTVGALALDRAGNLAAGTSTGGLTNKMHGRVGDSPIIGAGTYANNKTCAVSGTGQGEFFMRYLLAYSVSALMEFKGADLAAAANAVVHETLTGAGGDGGIIALDRNGNIAMPFNTKGMYRGWVKAGGDYHTFMYKDE